MPVQWKIKMKNVMIIIGVTLIYVIGIAYALMYLPFYDVPESLGSLFDRSSYGTLLWLKMRQFVVVAFIGSALAMFLLRYDRKNVQINSLLVGVMSVLWGIVFSWVVVGTVYLGWIEITDYLVVGLWIPLSTSLLCRCGNWRGKTSNQPLESPR
jgi:hypothetical protein